MKKALVLLAVLALVAPAAAKVQFFITSSAEPYGLTDPSLAFDPTLDTSTDGYSYIVGEFPPPVDPPVRPVIDPSVGEYGYVWIRFISDVAAAKVQGIHIGVQRGGAWLPEAPPFEYAWYICDHQADAGATMKRWDGPFTPPTDPEFKKNPQVLAAVTAYGIVNVKDPLNPWNLYSGNQDPTTTRTALLGAVKFEPGNYDVELALGNLGFKYAGTSVPTGIEFFGATIVPEPAGLLLLGLAAFALRRR